MQENRWERIADLFSELAAVAPERRDFLLRHACGDDAELSAELESLLRAHDQASGPLDRALSFALHGTESDESVDQPEALVGSYRLLRPIGEGGMGSVWLAERADGVLKRTVALKRPHVSWIGSLAERMAQERDILAGLEHPNIARLYDAGVTSTGQPYLALEYVEGVSLNEYCIANKLSIHQRLKLFLEVLEAVGYAHAHLVIHRDLKTSNILVSRDGRVHLLDFGIAKLLRQDGAADARSQGGAGFTPDYASPEQIRGEPISTASDLYSLGIVLHELMTGERPYRLQGKDTAELARALDQIKIIAPSATVADRALQHRLQGDLDSIICKALERGLTERYATTDALAADITRHLRDEPVAAHSDRLAYRMRKFFRRYRWQSVSAALATFALMTGAGLALWQAREARLEAARAEEVKSFALAMLDSADTDAGAGVATTAVDLLQAAGKRVETELSGRPAIAAELMTAIGYGLVGQDRAEYAAVLLKKAIDLSTQANGADHTRTVEAQVVYGEALYDLGKNDEAIAVLQRATALAHRVHDAHAEIDAWRWLSSAQIDAGNTEAAIASAHAAIRALPPSSAATDRRSLLDAMQAHATLANALVHSGGPDIAEEARSALRYAAQMGKTLEPTAALDNRVLLGIGLVREGKPAEGLQELKSAYADSRKFRGEDHRQSIIIGSLLGSSSLDAGDDPGALVALQNAFDSTMRHQDALGPYAVAYSHYDLAQALAATHDHARALLHFDEAARLFAQAGGPLAPLALRSRSQHALSLARLGRLAESDREFMDLATAPFAGADRPAHDGRLAVLRSLQGRHREAVALAQSSADGMKAFPAKIPRARSLASLGTILLADNRPDQAIAPLQQSIVLFEEAQLPESVERADALANLQRARGPSR
jgi:eukaryotic-like serine/threonine-protein kinase